MSISKKSVVQTGYTIKKKFYILTIIFILFTPALPLISIAGKTTVSPDLTIVSVTATPDPSFEGDIVHIAVTIKNIGDKNISTGESIKISVYLDDEQTATLSLTDTLGLAIGKKRTENLSWTATLGKTTQRILHISVVYSDDNNNIIQEIQILERKTDLLFVSTPTISGTAQLGKPITIAAIVKNIGKNTTNDINVSLYVDRALKQGYIKSGGLIKGESYELTFFWAPLTFGVHVINLTIDPKHTIGEQNETNNFYETPTSVIPWWNANWHYRRIYNVTGSGNLSLTVNFTTLLTSLNVINKTFEQATIKVIRYYTNGTMSSINKTWFNESQVYNNRTNALGTLAWNVAGPSLYGVYFDVIENKGTRWNITETLNIIQSGTAQASVVSTQGWWPEFVYPLKTYYPLNTMVSLQVNTTAKAKTMIARYSWDTHVEFNRTLHSIDDLTWSDTSPQLSKRGNWTITVTGFDDASYSTAPLTSHFYIGEPDLALTALSVADLCYLKYNTTITANVRAYNTSVQPVNVTLLVDNLNYASQKNLTILKDENRTLQFTWRPTKKGIHNVSVRIDFTDSNLKNNKKWKNVTVEGVPDLSVLNISVTPTSVNEGNPVTVTTRITNTGDGNATNYPFVLYCEQNGKYNDNTSMTMGFTDAVNSTTIHLKKGETKNISLTWEKTKYGRGSFHGEWAIGIQIKNTSATPDKYDADNSKALFHVLRVIPSERKPPVITNVNYLQTQEQGLPVLITAHITDESGIATVTISIKTPSKTYVNDSMTAEENNQYAYLFESTQIGWFTFFINATDGSPHHNRTTVSGSFQITTDKTPPTIQYCGVYPFVQLRNSQVEIRCIATDFSGIQSVDVTVYFPDNTTETYTMTNTPQDIKYVYIQTYTVLGEYIFTVRVKDNKGNYRITNEQTFWITNNLNDTDNDGMPDTWEERYGFNSYDPSDATQDEDNDGVINLQEYKEGTNPLKKLASSSEFFARLKENGMYLVASVFICLIIIVLALYGIRRLKQ